MKNFLLIVLLFIALVITAGYFMAQYTYSNGDRVGHLLKITEKGLLFKTYEGELNTGVVQIGNQTATPSPIWTFSVPHDMTAVFDSLNAFQGQEVKVHYRQRLYTFPWQGDSDYFVDQVSLVN